MIICYLPPVGSASGLDIHGAVRAVHLWTEALGVRSGPRGSAQWTHVLSQIRTQNLSGLVLQPVGSVHQLRLPIVLVRCTLYYQKQRTF